MKRQEKPNGRLDANGGSTEALDALAWMRRVADALGRDDIEFTLAARLAEDLDFDSLAIYELIVLMEELGADVPEALIPSLVTLGDVYDHYVTRTGGGVHRG